ncbi:MAG TPA: DUF1501 domain-containing protein, partial [Planctomycetes bacterium]|nr:DUF1501 domain-containing protein [Planctomycetota bacterium]
MRRSIPVSLPPGRRQRRRSSISKPRSPGTEKRRNSSMGIETTPKSRDDGSQRLSRRELLKRSALGLGLLPTMSWRSLAAMAQGPTHHTPTAKRMIVLFMSGGMSQLDLFDPKPLLNERRGEDLPPSIRKGTKSSQLTERQGALAVVGSRFEFKKYG